MKAENRSYGSATSAAAVVTAILLSMFLLLGASVPAASAAPEASPGWAFKGNFGEFLLFNFGLPRNPVAVDGDGNIVSADPNQVIRVYSPSADGGTLLSEFGGEVGRNVAVDLDSNAIYADGVFGGPLRRYLSDGAPTPTYTLDPTFEATAGEGIAVDPTTGDLLVADPGAEGVRRYDSSGTLLETIATPSLNSAWIAAAPDGSFYVAPGEGPDVTHFSGAGALLGTIPGVGPLHGLSYDPSLSAIVVAVGDVFQAYSAAGALLASSQAQSGGGLGLAIGASGSLYQVEGNLAYYAPGTVPGVEAPEVSALAVHSAHVSAEVDPGAGPPEGSVAHFEYSADGGTNWTPTPDVSVERTETEEPDTIEADLTGLKGNFDYLVRVVAGNSLTSRTSDSISFHTPLSPPEIETGPANSIAETKAQLTGTIDALGDQTTYHFEYGTTSSYGSKAPVAAEGVAGNERVPRTFSQGILGLQPNTTYHYRLVAKNSAGEAVGADRTFTTSGSGVVRGYEQVSPRNKTGGSVNPQLGFQAAADGSAIVYQVGQPSTEAASAPLWSRVLSRRSSTAWLEWKSTDPPIDAMSDVTETLTHAISSDFTHTVVVSNHVLAPGGIEGGGNIYIQDLETGEYTFVGGAPGQSAFLKLTYIAAENWFIAGAPDFSWVVLNAPNPMIPGAPLRGLYKWSREEGLQLESRLPDGSIPLGETGVPSTFEVDTFRQASDDGSVVYFSLSSWEGGVYRRSDGQTTAISVSQVPGDPSTVLGGVLEGASADGRYAFFRSSERLSSDAPPLPTEGPYLYRYDAEAGTLEFVDLIEGSFGLDVWGFGDDGQIVYYERPPALGGGTWVWNEGVKHQVTPSQATANSRNNLDADGVGVFASPNGRFAAFYEEDGSVHLYDAEAEEEVCVSCGVGNERGRLSPGVRTISNRHPEVVNDEGVVLFDSRNPLVAEDRNATYDVYRYDDGQLTLVSPGDGPYNARFADATPDGSDIFFSTDEGLVPGDLDRSIDLYDARVDGGFADAGAQAPECKGETCRPPIGSPPDLASPKGGAVTDPAPFAIGKVRPLSSADRKKLAKGRTARLRLTVSRPGTVRVTGKKVISSPVKARKSGVVSVPFSLSKAALDELRTKGKLPIKLSVHFGDASPKAVRLTLSAAATKKGGRS